MTIADWLVNSMVRLQKAGVENGRRECLILLADLFGKDKSWVHAHPEKKLSETQLDELNKNLVKRVGRVPLAYIRGFVEFYGRKFIVNQDVLIPRPESESFIDLLKEFKVDYLMKSSTTKIADVGAGSGCIGVTIKLEMPNLQVDLYDNSAEALKICAKNARNLGAEVSIYKSDLLDDLKDEYDLILANLPYVPESHITSPEITKEPSEALFSGTDGLDHYRKFWSQLNQKPSFVLAESLENQHKAMSKLADKAGYRLVATDILVQLYRKI